jgi:hypothetical protein
MKQVERGHWTNEAKEYYYAKRAAALGVRNREDSLKQNILKKISNLGALFQKPDQIKKIYLKKKLLS